MGIAALYFFVLHQFLHKFQLCCLLSIVDIVCLLHSSDETQLDRNPSKVFDIYIMVLYCVVLVINFEQIYILLN